MSLRGAAAVVKIGRNIWGAHNETKNKPQLRAFARHLRTATAPHRTLQPAKLRDVLLMGCAGASGEPDGSQPWAGRNDSRGVPVHSKLRASILF